MTTPPTTGPEAILAALQGMDLDELEKSQRDVIRSGSKTKRSRAVRLLNVVHGLRVNDVHPAQLMLTSVPVIPPKFRPFSVTGDTFLPGDSNEVYRDLLEYRRLYSATERLMGRDGASEAYLDMVRAAKAAYGYGDSPNPKTKAREVKGFLKMVTGTNPKTSFYQSRMLSKPVDTVGRGVIVPDAELGMDDVGVPEEMAWKLYGNYVQRTLVRSGMSPAAALKHLTERTPMARKALTDEMGTVRDKDGRDVPRRPVVITRSPAWHRTNVIGQRAFIVPGDAIRVNTFITEGQNADFDGDQCINQLFACIPNAELHNWRMIYPNIDNYAVRFPQGNGIPAVADSTTFVFDLEDFPHGDLLRSKDGAKGRIDFHAIPFDIRVLAHDPASSGLVWAQVSNWSKHYAREIEIVDTVNGYQIITDDDPRAVYGVAAGTIEPTRFTPTDALNQRALIPRARSIPALDVSVTSISGNQDSLSGRAIRMASEVSLDARAGWLIGAMCGDGWVIKAKNLTKGFAFADNDGFNIAKLTLAIRGVLGVNVSCCEVTMEKSETGDGRHGDTKSYRFPSTNTGAWFRNLIGGERDENTSGSANKHLPPFYLAAPEEFRSGLLCGLIDTDGSISISNGKERPQLMASMGSTSIRLVIEAKLLAASLGIPGRITPSKTPLGKDCWMLTFSAPAVQRWGAPYMCHEDKLRSLRSVAQIDDSPVTAKYDVTPIPTALASALRALVGCPKLTKAARDSASPEIAEKKLRQNFHVILGTACRPTHDKYGTMSRQAGEGIVALLSEAVVVALPDGAAWLRTLRATDVTWERVTGVQYTGVKEDGYDLTVPGYETFMSADGVILSNTMSVHVPTTDEAVKDVREKMMASKMLWSIKDRTKTMGNPKHEQILGLTMGQLPGGKRHKFANDDEAMSAIESGTVDLNDDIEIG